MADADLDRPCDTAAAVLRRRKSLHAFLELMLVCLLSSTGCVQRGERQVVVYCSVDRDFAAPILDAYERGNADVEVSRQYDVESTKSVGLANRILHEKSVPRCDVFWNGDILQTVRLQAAGRLEPFRPNLADAVPARFKGDDGTWYSTTARARVLIVNTALIPDAQSWPSRVTDLADETWKDKCGLASPLHGSTATHMLVLEQRDENFWDWFTTVADNARVLSGNKQVAQAVARGELAWGLTDTDDALVERENGQPVEIVLPDQGETEPGMLLVPYTVGIIKGGPHPVAARLLAEYLCGPQTTERLTMATAAPFDLTTDPPRSPQFRRSERLKFMAVDYLAAAKAWDQSTTRLEAILRKSRE